VTVDRVTRVIKRVRSIIKRIQ